MSMQEQLNFCFPLRTLANERVKLVAFEAEKHAQRAFDLAGSRPELYAYTPSGPYDSKEHFVQNFVQDTSLVNRGMATFAVIDKTRAASAEDPEGELAGTLSYMNSSVENGCTEIGYVYIFPGYQRTHVATNAVGLMMRYALDGPEKGGLGLRRVAWRAHAENRGSVKLAKRMGFVSEGITRWHWLFKDGSKKGKVGNGSPLPPGSDPDDLWRDTITLSHCWDAWLQGGKQVVEAAMDRIN